MGWDGPPTLRHFHLWQAWHDSRQRDPDQLCYYVMQLTAEVMRVEAFLGAITKSDLPSRLEDLVIKWERRESPSQAPSSTPSLSSSRKRRRRPAAVDHQKQQAAQWSKMRWHAALGGSVTVRMPGGKLKLPDGRVVDEAEYNARGK